MRVALLLARLAARLYRVYYRTLRVRFFLPDGTVLGSPFDYRYGREIFAICERDTVAVGGVLLARRFTILVAIGRDGDLATELIEALGTRVVRGSSRRGGARALTELIHTLRGTDEPATLIVDGPLGPSGVAKEGAVLCGLRTNRPVRPAGAAARRQIVFRKSWSRLFIPLPFTDVAYFVEDPIEPGQPGDRATTAALTEELTRRLGSAREKAIRALGTRETFGRQALASEGT